MASEESPSRRKRNSVSPSGSPPPHKAKLVARHHEDAASGGRGRKARLVPRAESAPPAEPAQPRAQLVARPAVAERNDKAKKAKKHQEEEKSAVADKAKKEKDVKKEKKDKEKEKSAVAEKDKKKQAPKEAQKQALKEAPKERPPEQTPKEAQKQAQKQAEKEERPPKQAVKEERPPKQAVKEKPRERKEAPQERKGQKEATKQPEGTGKKQGAKETSAVAEQLTGPAFRQKEPEPSAKKPTVPESSSDYDSYSSSDSVEGDSCPGKRVADAAAGSGTSRAEERARGPQQPAASAASASQPHQPAAPASEGAAVAAASPRDGSAVAGKRSSSSSSGRSINSSLRDVLGTPPGNTDDEAVAEAPAAQPGRGSSAAQAAHAAGVPVPPPPAQVEPHQHWAAWHHQQQWAHQQWGAWHQWNAAQSWGQQSSAVAEEAPEGSEYGYGQAQCVYVDVASGANLPELARDLRRQAPHVLLARCAEVAQRWQLHSLLATEASGDAGDQGRPEVPFLVEAQGPFLLAGRDGYVSEVMVHMYLALPGVGQIAIAEFSLSVSVQQMTSIKVAVVSLAPGGAGEGPAVAEYWAKVLDAIARKSVRFIAGDFADQTDRFLHQARESLQVRLCAAMQYDASGESLAATALFIVGPVGSVTGERLQDRVFSVTRGGGETPLEVETAIECATKAVGERPYSGAAGQDKSRGWPAIQSTKEKNPEVVIDRTKKVVIFFGSKASRRTYRGAQRREDNREKRAKKWDERTGQQQHWRKTTQSGY